jgi:hypothetical protein
VAAELILSARHRTNTKFGKLQKIKAFSAKRIIPFEKIQLELALAAIEQFELRSTFKWREHLASRFANATLNRRE